MGANRVVTESHQERMTVLRERGWTYRRIGEAIGISAETVSWHCLKMGVEAPKPSQSWEGIKGPAVTLRNGFEVRRFTEDDDAALLALEGQGLTYSEIGRRLNRRRNSIMARLMILARRDARREAA